MSDVEALTEALYRWYLNPTPLPAPIGPLQPFELSLPAALRAAPAASTSNEGGWRAESVSRSRALAHRGDLTRVLERRQYRVPVRPELRAEPGDALLVSADAIVLRGGARPHAAGALYLGPQDFAQLEPELPAAAEALFTHLRSPYSLATSSAEVALRGMEFLCSLKPRQSRYLPTCAVWPSCSRART